MKYKALMNMSLLTELKVFAWMFFYKYNAPSELKSLDFINESSFLLIRQSQNSEKQIIHIKYISHAHP
jgi:hypothetical protein